jgi:hypothetical protein
VGKRRWRARTPKPGGTSDAPREREASWSAERQFRFGRQTGAFDQFGEFCLTPLFPGRMTKLFISLAGTARSAVRASQRDARILGKSIATAKAARKGGPDETSEQCFPMTNDKFAMTNSQSRRPKSQSIPSPTRFAEKSQIHART